MEKSSKWNSCNTSSHQLRKRKGGREIIVTRFSAALCVDFVAKANPAETFFFQSGCQEASEEAAVEK